MADSARRIVMPPFPEDRFVDAVEKGTFRVLIGNDVRSIDAISRLSPRRAIVLIADQMKKLLG